MTAAPHSIDDVIELFSLLEDDWEERYRYLIDLGKTVPAMSSEMKIESNKIQGCTSQVWMVAKIRDGKLDFQADSDGKIVKGLIGLLILVFQGKTPEEIAAINISHIFEKLGLEQNLSPNRRNGFYAMVDRLKQFA